MSPLARVAVTGASALTPAGEGLEVMAEWLPRAAAAAGARVPNFEAADYIPNPKLLRSMHRSFQLGTAAAVLAMRAAGLNAAGDLPAAGIVPGRSGVAAALADVSPLTRDLLEVLAATSQGDGGVAWAEFAELGLHQLHPFRRLTLLANMAAAHTSLLFGLQGPSFTFTSGGAAGAQTLEQALWTIAEGRADLMICQSADSPDQAFARHPGPEVAAALLLERWEIAHARRAPILAELIPNPEPLPAPASISLAPTFSLLYALCGLGPPTAPARRIELSALLGVPAAMGAETVSRPTLARPAQEKLA